MLRINCARPSTQAQDMIKELAVRQNKHLEVLKVGNGEVALLKDRFQAESLIGNKRAGCALRAAEPEG